MVLLVRTHSGRIMHVHPGELYIYIYILYILYITYYI